jgi:hypothetical protein
VQCLIDRRARSPVVPLPMRSSYPSPHRILGPGGVRVCGHGSGAAWVKVLRVGRQPSRDGYLMMPTIPFMCPHVQAGKMHKSLEKYLMRSLRGSMT